MRVLRRDWLFAAVLAVSALLRADAELGYRWQSWFNDSWSYLDTAVTLSPNPTRVSGYSLYLFLLRPFHSFALVTVSQHVMGLATGVLIYALARRFSCPRWAAVALSLPVLFDGFEIQLEHLVMSDTLFLFLVMLALTLLLWSPPTWPRCAAAGVAIGLSAVVRPTGLPLIPLIVAWIVLALMLSRPRWKTIVASAAAFAVTALAPTAAYATWYHQEHGTFNTSESTGVYLYSRVMSFAECQKMGRLPADLLSLCSTVPPSRRPIAQDYIWATGSPLGRFPPPKFTALPNSLAQQFAIRAIEAQPLDYARVILDDTWRAFSWPRTAFPNAATYDEYLFGPAPVPISPSHPADGYPSSAQAYLAGGSPETAVVSPFAGIISGYQRYVYLPGTVYGVLLLAGLAGIVVSWRRRAARGTPETPGGPAALLPWATSLALVMAPAATAEFDYRYVTTAVPFGCLALAIACAPGLTRRLTGRLTRRLAGGGSRRGTAEPRHDQRDLAPDSP